MEMISIEMVNNTVILLQDHDMNADDYTLNEKLSAQARPEYRKYRLDTRKEKKKDKEEEERAKTWVHIYMNYFPFYTHYSLHSSYKFSQSN